MTTARDLRSVLVMSANGSMRDEPSNVDFRARMFIARLCGSMSAMGDEDLASMLRTVLGLPNQPSDGA